MRSSILAASLFSLTVSAAPAATGQQPFKFPLSNGFPNVAVGSSQLTAIQKQAHGTLPNGPLPTSINDTSATTWQLIAFNEIFEVAFFTNLIQNITNNVPGYQIGNKAFRDTILTDLTAIQAQEELHALGANAILSSAKRTPVQACEYIFPVDCFEDAIAFASTFTDVVLGTLQDAQVNFGADGDDEFLALVGGVIGQEGEQNGVYRSIGGKIPSALPFLTRSAGPLAFSVLNQMIIKPGSCPNANVINLPIFGALNVATPNIQAKTQTLSFNFKNTKNIATSNLSLVYINQQNVPVVVKPQNVKTSGQTVSFTANFPYDQYLMNGLTLAAVTTKAGPFAGADDVASATVFGPGLIEIN